MLWQHDFWMKPKNFAVKYPHRQQGHDPWHTLYIDIAISGSAIRIEI